MSSDDPTLPDATTDVRTAGSTRVTVVPDPDGKVAELPPAGYELGDVIGRGGMGEVVSAHDRRIGREVAIKRLREDAPQSSSINRFYREARIQARLDHPAVVPVHELGIDSDGRPFFTMKRLAGVTLAQRLGEKAPVKPMLRAFVDVCLAIQFAHERGCVHRDLKPSNIMVGEYGEVYVLDWGVARELDERASAAHYDSQADTPEADTRTGELLGTPGYMAPEHLRGQIAGPAADVYALGAILFEILAGEPLHPRGAAGLTSTLAMPRQAPAERTPERDIAPELDAACAAALAEDPGTRPCARELADRVQRYLDGDRDIERRRTLAIAQLALAREAIDSGDPERRASAMHCAGRALALDPDSRDAMQLVTKLIVEPPQTLPRALDEELAAEERRVGTSRLVASVRGLVMLFSLTLLLPLLQVRSWSSVVAIIGVWAVIVGALSYARYKGKPHPALSLIIGIALAFSVSRVAGVFVLTPVVIAGSMAAISANAWLNKRPGMLFAWLLCAALGPLVLEWIGVFRSTWYMIDGGMCTVSAMLKGRDPTDALVLVVSNLVTLAGATLYGIRSNRAAIEARRNVTVQAWHLHHLLPKLTTR